MPRKHKRRRGWKGPRLVSPTLLKAGSVRAASRWEHLQAQRRYNLSVAQKSHPWAELEPPASPRGPPAQEAHRGGGRGLQALPELRHGVPVSSSVSPGHGPQPAGRLPVLPSASPWPCLATTGPSPTPLATAGPEPGPGPNSWFALSAATSPGARSRLRALGCLPRGRPRSPCSCGPRLGLPRWLRGPPSAPRP